MELIMRIILAQKWEIVRGLILRRSKLMGSFYLVTMKREDGSIVTGYVKVDDMPRQALAAE